MDIDKATATQLANIEKRTGKTLAQLEKVVTGSGLTKHGELVAMLKQDLGMGHGDANTLVHYTRAPATPAREKGRVGMSSMTSMPDPRRISGRSTTR